MEEGTTDAVVDVRMDGAVVEIAGAVDEISAVEIGVEEIAGVVRIEVGAVTIAESAGRKSRYLRVSRRRSSRRKRRCRTCPSISGRRSEPFPWLTSPR